MYAMSFWPRKMLKVTVGDLIGVVRDRVEVCAS